MRFLTLARTRDRTAQQPEHAPAADAQSDGCCAFDLVADDEQPEDDPSAARSS